MIAASKSLKDFVRPLFLVSALLLLDGCTDSSNEQSQQVIPPKVALIMKSLANEFFVNMQRAAEAHQAEQPEVYTLVANGIKNERLSAASCAC